MLSPYPPFGQVYQQPFNGNRFDKTYHTGDTLFDPDDSTIVYKVTGNDLDQLNLLRQRLFLRPVTTETQTDSMTAMSHLLAFMAHLRQKASTR